MPEPEHIFRVRYPDGRAEFIAADAIDTSADGTTRLWVRSAQGSPYGSLVARIGPRPNLTVVRVDCLITPQSLEQA